MSDIKKIQAYEINGNLYTEETIHGYLENKADIALENALDKIKFDILKYISCSNGDEEDIANEVAGELINRIIEDFDELYNVRNEEIGNIRSKIESCDEEYEDEPYKKFNR